MVMLSSGQHLKAPWPNRCCGVRFELAPVKGIGLAPSIGARRATKVAPLLQNKKILRQGLKFVRFEVDKAVIRSGFCNPSSWEAGI